MQIFTTILNTKIRLWAVFFWVLVWQLASMSVGHGFLLPTPLDVLSALARIAAEGGFYVTIAASVGRILLGFCIGALLAIVAASLSAANRIFCRLISPLVFTIKTVPVTSFIILVLVWASSRQLPTTISAMMVFPVMYTNILAGITGCDRSLLEMAEVFGVSRSGKILCIYIPEVMPYFRSGASLALGLAWKAGVAAEVIGLPKHSIGENLYSAKITLSTDELLAWTLVIIALSILFEKVFIKLLNTALRHTETNLCEKVTDIQKPTNTLVNKQTSSITAIDLRNVSKTFDNKSVLKNITFTANPREHIVITGESGCGKTTLLRLIMGLEAPDNSAKKNSENPSIAAVFQEDRLVESLSAAANIKLTMSTALDQTAEEQTIMLLSEVGMENEYATPVKQLSGGMKRRVSILRALGADADIIILDEPLQGMDAETKDKTGRLLKKHIGGKTVIYVTHDISEAKYLQNPVVYTIKDGTL